MSTNNISSHPEFEVVPATGSFSDNNKKSIDNFSDMITYNELVGSADLFKEKLKEYLGDGGDKPLRFPNVGGSVLDLHRLFMEVTNRGGIEKVIQDRKCKEVIETFSFEKPVTNAANILRKHYINMLLKLEHVYFFKEPLSSFSVKEQAMNRLVNKPNEGQDEIGRIITGVIDEKFLSGYLVTMKLGRKEFKGVIYPVAETSTSKKRKKRSKPVQVDALRPKRHRSGYNFFVSEHYPKLKAEIAGGELQFIMQEIGKMWRGLSEAERKAYKEKGDEDLQRYKREKAEYKSSAGEAVAATGTNGASDAPTVGAMDVMVAEADGENAAEIVAVDTDAPIVDVMVAATEGENVAEMVEATSEETDAPIVASMDVVVAETDGTIVGESDAATDEEMEEEDDMVAEVTDEMVAAAIGAAVAPAVSDSEAMVIDAADAVMKEVVVAATDAMAIADDEENATEVDAVDPAANGAVTDVTEAPAMETDARVTLA